MRTLFKFLVLALVFGFYAVIMSGCAQQPLASRILPTAVHIFTVDAECSGTIIRARRGEVVILTARHCVEEPLDYVQVGALPRKYRHFTHILLSRGFDLALVELKGMGTQSFAVIADSPIPRGEPFELVGLSSEVPWAISRGFIMGDSLRINYDKYHSLDVPLACMGCDSGDSGSGIFNSAGLLSGVLAAMSQNNVRTYAVPLHDIRTFLAKALK
jgi:Trypsin-like peptidase domain